MNRNIDAHQHFWQYSSTNHAWMSDQMGILKTDYLPNQLEPILLAHGFSGCVAVQAAQHESENNFLITLAQANPFIKGIVGWVDLKAQNLIERLEYYQHSNVIKGFRHIVQDEPNQDFIADPAFIKGVSALRKFGFTYDILIYPRHLPATISFLKALPEQPFVIDHLAKPNIKNGEISQWKKHIKELGSFKNLSCKISGMVTEADWHQWTQSDFRPYLDTIIDAFGTSRIIYGSDWPVCTLAASYADQLNLVVDYFSAFSQEDQDLFFGGNATTFYHLS